MIVRPQKKWLRLEYRLDRSDETERDLEQAGIDVMDYSRWGRYGVRLSPGEVEKHRDLLSRYLNRSFEESGGAG